MTIRSIIHALGEILFLIGKITIVVAISIVATGYLLSLFGQTKETVNVFLYFVIYIWMLFVTLGLVRNE